MSAFEVEGYIFTGTLVLSYLIKSAKWIVEETLELVTQCKKLRTTMASKNVVEVAALNRSPAALQRAVAPKTTEHKPRNLSLPWK
jgi:hypothetical protein